MASGGKASSGRLLDDPQVAAMLAGVSDFTLSETDAEGICTRFEPYSELYTLAPPTDIIGRRLDFYYPEEERAKGMYERVLAAARAYGRVQAEGWRYRIDGTRRWMRFCIEPRRDEAGKITGFVGVSYDATHERDSQRQLYASEEAMRFLVNGLADHAIYMLDPDGTVINWNAGAERLEGYFAEEIVGRDFSCFFTEEDRAAGLPAEALAAARDEGRYEAEGWRVRKDGSRFRAHVLIQPLLDYEDNFVGFAKMTRDISATHRAAEELAAAQEALSQAQRLHALGELTGGIAHDFNSLLTVIRGSAELLTRPSFPDAKRERQLRAIIDTADRAAELTGQLLAFARRQPLQPRLIDLNEQIRGMADLLERTLGKRIAIETRLAPDPWPVMADPRQLHSVILNAAINARDAMTGSGRVTFTTENVASPAGDTVRLAIADDGQGMTDEVKAQAFEPFFTTKEVGKGTGLGLSQAYGFAAQSGGRIEIESALGEGTTLNLYLPRAVAEAGETASEARGRRDIGAPARGTRVLLVEDSRTVASFAEALLEDMGCETVHAANAEQALAALAEERFDVVFSDIVMPGLSGLELAARLRAERPRLPILLATGYSEAAARGEGSEFPILPKPYRREALAAMLGKAIEARRLAA